MVNGATQICKKQYSIMQYYFNVRWNDEPTTRYHHVIRVIFLV